MRKDLPRKKKHLFYSSLKSVLLFTGLVLFAENITGQSVASLEYCYSDDANYPNRIGDKIEHIIPDYAESSGTWSTSAPITFDDPNDFYTAISATSTPVPGTTYSIYWDYPAGWDGWYHYPAGTYEVSVTFTGPTDITLTTPDNTICEADLPANIPIEIAINNGQGTYSVVIEKDGTYETTLSVTAGSSASYTSSVNSGATYSVSSITPQGSACPIDYTYASLPADLNITVQPVPSVQTVTGTSVCYPNPINDITLTGSEAGVTYILKYDNGSTVTDEQSWTSTANGQTHTFNVEPGVGRYYVMADGCGGKINMSGGPFYVYALPQTFNITTTSPACPGTELLISDSETGVDYYILKDGVRTGTHFAGDGSTSPFSLGILSDAGLYTVEAQSRAGGCVQPLGGALEIESNPTEVILSATPRDYYCSTLAPYTGVNLQLSGSDADVNYTLQKYDETSFSWVNAGTPPVGGTGYPINPAWTDVEDGIYRAVAVKNSTAACTRNMLGTPDITAYDPPTGTLTRYSDSEKCEGSTYEFKISVDLTGNPPFNFDIVRSDGFGGTTTHLNSSSNNVIFTDSPSANGTYTYTLTNLTNASGCAAVNNIQSMSFVVNPLPSIDFNSPNGVYIDGSGMATTEVCYGESVDITAVPYPTPGSYSYRWSNAVGLLVGNTPAITVKPSSTSIYSVEVTDDGTGCSQTRDIQVIVNPLPILDFTPGNGIDLCRNQGLVDLIPTSPGPTGGSFEGETGVVSGTTFDPAAAAALPNGIGWHNITYKYADPTTGCKDSVTHRVFVRDTVFLSTTLQSSYCADETPTVWGNPRAPGGNPTWSVEGMASNPGWFNDTGGELVLDVNKAVQESGERTYTFVYSYEDPTYHCESQILATTTFYRDFNDALDFYYKDANNTWTVFPDPATDTLKVCKDSDPINLKAFFAVTGGSIDTTKAVTSGTGFGGHFSASGNGLTDNNDNTAVFSPQNADNGVYTITYEYVDSHGCTGSVTYNIRVGAEVMFNNLDGIYCVDDNTTHTISASPADPSLPKGGTLNVYRATLNEYETASPPLSPALRVTTTSTDPSIDLIPSVLGPDTLVFEYRYPVNDFYGNGICETVLTQEVIIPEIIDASFTTSDNKTSYCINHGPVTFDPAQNAGSYSGDGVSLYSFDPAVADAGAHIITHEINKDGCYSKATLTLTVIDPKVGIVLKNSTFCQNDSSLFPVEAATLVMNSGYYVADKGFEDATYTFSAPTKCFFRWDDTNKKRINYKDTYSVEDADSCIYFDPLKAPVGDFFITLTFDMGDGVCSNITEDLKVIIKESPAVNFGTTDPLEFCKNSTPVMLTGRYAGGGTTGSGYFMLGDFFTGDPNALGIDNSATGDSNDGQAEFDPSKVNPSKTKQVTYVYEQGGCTSYRTKEFKIKDAPAVFDVTPATPGGGIYCYGSGSVTIGLSSSESGVTYSLLKDGAEVDTSTPTTGSAFTFSPVTEEGTYTVQAEITTGGTDVCTSMMNGTVEVRESKVTAVVDDVVDATCNGALDGEIHVSASSLADDFVYTLSEYDSGSGTYVDVANSNTGIFVGYGASDNTHPYHISVTDGYGCELASALSYLEVDIDEPALITLTSGQEKDVTCSGGNDGSFRVTATGVASGNYEFSTDGGTTWVTNGTSQYTFIGLYAGTYNVLVRDAGNPACVQSLTPSVVIGEPGGPVTIADDNVVDVDCTADGEIQVEAQQSGYSGSFYYVLYREASSGNWVQVDDDTQASGTSVVFPVSLGGEYRVNIYGENSCSISEYYTVNAPASVPVISLAGSGITQESTPGAGDGSIEIGITGGVAPYSITWSGTETSTGTPVTGLVADVTLQTNLPAGTYEVTVTDVNGCHATLSNLKVEANPVYGIVSTTKDPGPCFGNANGEISLTAQGGVLPYASITLTNSSGDVITPTTSGNTYANYTGLPAGNYTATVVDDRPATHSETIVLNENKELILDFSKNSDAACFGEKGKVTFDATGGVPFPGDGNPADTSIPDNPYYRYTIIPELGPNTVILAELGDSPNPDLPAGNYELQVRDAAGCYSNVFFEITEPDELTVNVTGHKDVKCFNGTDGEITVSVTGRPAGTNFDYTLEVYDDVSSAWNVDKNVAGTSSVTFSSLSAGSYRVMVSEPATSCTSAYSGTITIGQPNAAVTLTKVDSTEVTTCYGDNSGSVSLTVTGSTPPYIIKYGTVEDSWDGLNYYIADGLSAGTYTFEVVDANECSSSVSETITEPDAFGVFDISSGIKCGNLTSGYVTFKVSGGLDDGSGNYTYHVRVVRHENNQVYVDQDITNPVNPVSTNDLIAGVDKLIEGTYTLQVYDANSGDPSACSFEHEISIKNLSYSVSVTHPTCPGKDNGSIVLTVSGGSGDYSYTWNDGTSDFSTDQNVYNLKPGTYSLTLKDNIENCTLTEPFNLDYQHILSIGVDITDASCFNSADGKAIAKASGGVAPYEYHWAQYNSTTTGWDPVINAASIEGLAEGEFYMVTATDVNGCKVSSPDVTTDPDVIKVDEPQDFGIVLPVAYNPQKVSCNGSADGGFTVTPSRAGDFEYSIDGGTTWQTSPTFSGLSAGGYQVSMRDRNTPQPYCTKYDLVNAEITEPDALLINHINTDDVVCKGAETGAVEVEVFGGTPDASGNYTYQWYRVTPSGRITLSDPLQTPTTSKATNLPAGEYQVMVTDDNGCRLWSDVYDVSEPATYPSITVESVTNVSVNGDSDGRIEVSADGGTPGYTFSWENPDGTVRTETGPVINGLSAGIYTVSVEDAEGCTTTGTKITITEPGATLTLTVSASTDPGPCSGAANGSIELSATGGQVPYTFTLTRQPGEVITATSVSGGFAYYNNLEAGFYNAQVKDANGIVVVHPVDIELAVPDPVVLTITNESAASCYNEEDASVSFMITGGSGHYSYTLYSDKKGTVGNGNYTSGDPNVTLSALAADDYEIVVADKNQCSTSETFTLSQPAGVSFDVIDTHPVTCNGGDDGAITVRVNGRPSGTAFTYTWEMDADKDGPGGYASIPGTTGTLTSLEAAYYRVSAVESVTGCPVPEVVIDVKEPDAVSLTMVAQTDVTTCHGDNSGSVRLSVTGGTAPYTIKYGSVEDSWDGTSDYVASGLLAGTYSFEVFDAKGCSDNISSVTINEPAPLEVKDFDYGIKCDQLTSGWLNFNVSGGVDDGGYKYDVRLVRKEDNQEYYNSLLSYTPATPGDVLPVSIPNLVEGNYKLEVFDANSTASDGCLFEYEFSIKNISINANVVHPTCSGEDNGSIDISVTGGSGSYTYQWSDGSGSFTSTDEDISGLAPETYTLVVTDYSGQPNACSITQSFDLAYQNTLSVDVDITDLTCFESNDGRLIATASGGVAPYNYIWEAYNTATSSWETVRNSQVIEGLSAGFYRVTVIDDNGCEVATPDDITEPDVISISQPDDFGLAFVYNRQEVSCNGGNDGSITITPNPVAGNFEYSIDGGTTWQINPTFDKLYAGIYALSMRDVDTRTPAGTYCTKLNIENVEITRPDPLVVNLVNQEDVHCKGAISTTGSVIEVNVTGGTPDISSGTPEYVYQWYRVIGSVNDILTGENAATLSGRPAGEYRVQVFDDNNCDVWSDIYTISEPAEALIITIEDVHHPSAPGATDGSITISISGGTGNYHIVWEDSAGNNEGTDVVSISGKGKDTYTVTVEDDNGCTKQQLIPLSEPNDPLSLTITEQTHPGPCNDAANGGVLEFQVTGGNNASYTFTLIRQPSTVIPNTPPASVSGNIARYEGLEPGFYTGRVEDANGVVVSQTGIDLTAPDPLVLTISGITDASCNNPGNDGTITFSASGGTASTYYDYSIIPESSGAPLTGTIPVSGSEYLTSLEAGNYELYVTDETGVCNESQLFTIEKPDPVSITGTVTNISCNGESDGEISISVTGGHGEYTPYTYTWYQLDTGADPVDPSDDTWQVYKVVNDGSTTIDQLPAGSYYVEATELVPTGCSKESGIFVVTQPGTLVVTAAPSDVTTCDGDASGSIDVNVTGGTPPYTIDYGTGTLTGGGPVFTIKGLTANIYTITIWDDHSCEKVVPNITINGPDAPLAISNVTPFIECVEAGNETSGTVSFDISGGVANSSGEYSYHVRLLNTNTSVIQTYSVSATTTQPETVSFSGLVAGNYEIRVTDTQADPSSGCVNPVTDMFTLEHVAISGEKVNATCSGQHDGEIINVKVTGASSSYVFNWTTADGSGLDNSSLDQSGLSPGTYTLTVIDPGRDSDPLTPPDECVVTRDFVVANEHTLSISASVKDVSCAGGNDGAIRNVLVNGASDPSSPLQYVWQGPGIGTVVQTSDQYGFDPNLYNLEAGSYTLSVSDGNSCEVAAVFVVEEPAPIDYTLSSTLDDCDPYTRTINIVGLDGSDGTGDPANFTYVWNGPGNFTKAPDGKSITNVKETGTYTVRVTDEAGCSLEQSIDVFGEINVDADITHVRCFDGKDGSIVLTITGGSGDYTYSWTDEAGDPTDHAGDKNQNLLAAGKYTVEITDNDASQKCLDDNTQHSITRTFTIDQPTEIVVGYTKRDVSCSGEADGQITLDVTGGSDSYIYDWTPATAPGIVQGVHKQVGLGGGSYGVTVTDALTGCQESEVIDIIDPAALDFELDTTDTNCAGENEIAIVAGTGTGGTGSYEFSATGPGVPAGWDGSTPLKDLPGGEYTIIMTDTGSPGGCFVSKTIILTKLISVSVDAVIKETCPGSRNGAIVLNVSGGKAPVSYTWHDENGDPTDSPNNKNQAGLSGGIYTVKYKDAGSCEDSLKVEVPVLNDIEINPSVVPIACYGEKTGAISLSPTGGSGNYDFVWSGPGGFSSDQKDISGLAGGTYYIEVIDKQIEHSGISCRFVETVVVPYPPAPIEVTDVDITNVKCYGSKTGNIEVTVQGGMQDGNYTYSWSGPGDLSGQTTNVLSNVYAGDYNLSVTDGETGCVVSFGPYTITQPLQPLNIILDEVLPVTVPGGSNGAIQVNVTGGTGSYSYSWTETTGSFSGTFDDSNRNEPLTAGTYKITVTDDNNCTDDITVVVTDPDSPLQIDESHEDVRPCNGNNNGEIRIQISGGTPDMSSGSATYHIVVTRGGADIYNDHDDFIDLKNLLPGNYHIEVSDANGVTTDKDVVINNPDLLEIDTNVTSVTCTGDNTGSIDVTVSGGIRATGGNYQLQLVGPEETTSLIPTTGSYTFPDLVAGDYTLRVWDDSNGNASFESGTVDDDCYQTVSLFVPEPGAVVALNVVPGYETLCEGEMPRLNLSVTNWDFDTQPDLDVALNDGTVVTVDKSPFSFEPDNVPLTDTGYEVTSVNETGGSCSKGSGEGMATVTVNEIPEATIYGTDSICPGGSGAIRVDLTGSAPWEIVYTDGTNNYTESNIITSTYTISVSPVETTDYKLVSVSDSHCPGMVSGEAQIAVDPPATVGLSAPAVPEICRGETSYIDFVFHPNTNGPWVVTYEEKPDGESPVSHTVTYDETDLKVAGEDTVRLDVTPLVSTIYTLISATDTYTGSSGCPCSIDGLPVTITVSHVPEAAGVITGKSEVCQIDKADYSVADITDADSYTWTVPAEVGTIISGNGTKEIEIEFNATSKSGYITVQGTNSCGNGPLNRLYITVRPAPVVGAINGPDELCQAEKGVKYSVSPVATVSGYQWTVPEGLTIVSGQGSASIIVNVDEVTTGTSGKIEVTPYNSCGLSPTSQEKSVTVHPIPEARAGTDRMVCGTVLSGPGLQANSPGTVETGLWSIVRGYGDISNKNDSNATLMNISSGDLILEWKVTDNTTQCYNTDTVVVRNNKLYVQARADNSLTCDGATDIYGTLVPGYDNTSGVWSVASGSGTFEDASSAGTTVFDLGPGKNILRWTITQNACPSSAEVTVVNDQPDQAVIDQEDTIDVCGDAYTLTANKDNLSFDGVGTWSVVGGSANLNVSGTNDSRVDITNLARGENKICWAITKNGNCSSADTVVIRNNQLEVKAGDDFTTCDDEVLLTGTDLPAGVTGLWSAGGGALGVVIFSDATAHKTVVSDLVNGENKLYWTLTKNGCSSTGSIVVTSYSPTVATVGSMQTICSNEATLTGNTHESSESGTWTIVQGRGKFDDDNDPETKVTNVGYGTNIYRWTITNGNCSSSADLTIVNDKVEAFAGKDTVTCSRSINLNADPAPNGYTGEWSIKSDGGSAIFPYSRSNPKALVNLGLDNNILYWTLENKNSKCRSTDSVTIVVNAIDNVDAGGDQIINDGSSQVTMQADLPDNATGEWSIISGGGTITDVTDPGTTITNLNGGPNSFKWTVKVGDCTKSDSVIVTNGNVVEADAGSAITTCIPEAKMHANSAGDAFGRWVTGGKGSGNFEDDTDPETRVYNLSPGENKFVWTITYGEGISTSTDTVVVTNNQPNEARAKNGRPICTDEFLLEGNEPDAGMGTNYWRQIAGGGEIEDSLAASTMVRNLVQGLNKFVYTIKKEQCFLTDTIEVINGTPTQPYAGENDTLCVDSVLLEPNVPNHGTGEWQILTGGAEFEPNSNMARRINTGKNEFLWVVSTDYCSLQDTVVIVNNKPTDAIAGDNRPVCADSALLAGNLPTYYKGKWTRISGSGVFENDTLAETMVRGLAAGENRFRWTVTNNKCSDFDEVIIRNDFREAKIYYNNPEPLCEDTALLSANNPVPGGGTWGVIGGGGAASFEDLKDPNTIVRDLDRGKNTITWTVSLGNCSDVDSISIVNNQPTFASAGDNVPTCESSIYLSANHPLVGSGKWSIRNGSGKFVSDVDENTRVDSLNRGSNIFRWTIVHEGCQSFDDVQIDYNSMEAYAGADTVLCSDELPRLQGKDPSPGSGRWSVAGGLSQASFDNITDPNTAVRNLGKGSNVLRWTVNYKGCETIDEVTLVNSMPSAAGAGNMQEICTDEVFLNATDPEIGYGMWERVSASGTFENGDSLKANVKVTGLKQGDNVFRWTTRNGTCSSSDEVLIINNLPEKPYAGDDMEICRNYYTLKAKKIDFGKGFWSIDGTGGGNIENINASETEIRNLMQGENRLKWTVSKGQCSLSDVVVITNNMATTANAGSDVADCKDWAILDGNPVSPGETGEWILISGNGSLEDVEYEATHVNDLGFGENVFMWEIWNGDKCFSRDTVVIFNKVPEQSAAGRDKEICESYLTLNANTAPEEALGTWSVVSGAGKFDSPHSPNSIVRDIGFGDNVYKWTISYDDCVTESTVAIRSDKTDAYAGDDVVVYNPEVLLNANNVGDLNASWSIVGGAGEFEDPTFFNPLVTGLNEGVNTYRWSIDVAGCNSFDDVSVEYRPVPDAGFITDGDNGCWPMTVLFTNYSVGVQDRDYLWDFGDGTTSGDQNPTHTFEDPGDYPVVLTVPGPDGIEGRYQKIIRVHEHPEAAFSVTPEEVYVPGDEVRFFDLSVGAVEYEWRFGDGNTSNEPHPVHEYAESGVYDVMLSVTNEYGCKDSTITEGAVTAISNGFIKFPNAFKPRPDGGSSHQASETNNIFKPVCRDVDTYHLQIYNRWGQLIYQSDDIDDGWNGFYKGQLAPQAVYVWKVSGTFVNGREFRQTGSVLLVR